MNFKRSQLLTVNIEEDYINVVYSRNNKIQFADRISIENDVFIDGDISDVTLLSMKLQDYIDEKKITCKDIIFVIGGNDIIVRHAEVPIMDKSKILNAAKWEMLQYLPEQGEKHYIDYEIVDKIENEEKKVYDVLVAAAPKEKIDTYKELADKLGLKLLAVDINANNISRVFKKVYENYSQAENLGVINIGYKSTNFVIIKNGKLYLQKEIPFGRESIKNQLMNGYSMDCQAAEDLMGTVDLNSISEENDREDRIKRSVDSILTSFDKVIKFYFTGSSIKNLDEIYIVGEGSTLTGLKGYVASFLNTEVVIDSDNVKNRIGLSYSEGIDIDSCIYAVGSLLRNDKQHEINLIPYELKKDSKIHIEEGLKYAICIFAVVMFIATVIPLLYSFKLNCDRDKAQQRVANYDSVMRTNRELKTKVDFYNNAIVQSKTLKPADAYTALWIRGLEKYEPTDVKVQSMSKNGAVCTLVCTAQNINSPAVFAANLQQSEDYKSTKIVSITKDTNNYKFNLQIGVIVK